METLEALSWAMRTYADYSSKWAQDLKKIPILFLNLRKAERAVSPPMEWQRNWIDQQYHSDYHQNIKINLSKIMSQTPQTVS